MNDKSKEKDCGWYFSEWKIGNTKQGPNSAISCNFSGTPIPSLVRESIQNSIDVRDKASKPVEMTFQFGHIQSQMYPNFFKLHKHILGMGDAYPEMSYRSRAMASRLLSRTGRVSQINYIKISDTNTTGMSYDRNTNNSKFDAFVQSEGTTAKDSPNSGGHYGFGKAAYFNISPIRTLLVSSCTKDNRRFFQGVSMLCTNEVDGITYNPRGLYDNNGGYPVEDPDQIPEKFRKDNPGTDIYIMGIDIDKVEGYCKEIIIESIRNFWPAILSGMLTVTVKRGDSIIDTVNAENLDENIRSLDFTTSDGNKSQYNPLPFYELYKNYGTDSTVYYKVTEHLPNLGEVSLYLAKQKGVKDTIAYYRMPHMIVCAKKFSTDYGFYGLFECLNPDGDEYLGKIESSSHDEWHKKHWTTEDNEVVPKAAIIQSELDKFLRDAVKSLFQSEIKSTCSFSAFSKYMTIPEENDSSVDDDVDTNPFSGNISPKLGDPEVPTTSTRKKKIKKLTKKQKQNVMAVVNTNATKDDKGDLKGGPTGHIKTPKPEPQPNPGPDSFKEDKDGKKGTFARPIQVSARIISQPRTDGKKGFKHICKINNPDEDVSNGRIEFVTRGEQQDEKIPILSSSAGQIKGNMLTNLQISHGLNEIIITFNDDIRHSLKLSVYEDRS